MMLETSLLTLTYFIPNTYVVREYYDKHFIQRQTGWFDGSVELEENSENLIISLVVKIIMYILFK